MQLYGIITNESTGMCIRGLRKAFMKAVQALCTDIRTRKLARFASFFVYIPAFCVGVPSAIQQGYT